MQLYRWRNPQDNISNPGEDKILKYCNISKRTLYRYEKKMVEEGFIRRLDKGKYELLIIPIDGNFTVMNKFIIQNKYLTVKERVMLGHLIRLTDRKSNKCIIGRKSLATRMRVSESTVVEVRQSLIDKKQIKDYTTQKNYDKNYGIKFFYDEKGNRFCGKGYEIINNFIPSYNLNDFLKDYYPNCSTIKEAFDEIEKYKIDKNKLLSYNNFLNSIYWKTISYYLRDKYNCQKCGSKEKLIVHHKNYYHHRNEHDHLEDLEVLCDKCHKTLHDIS